MYDILKARLSKDAIRILSECCYQNTTRMLTEIIKVLEYYQKSIRNLLETYQTPMLTRELLSVPLAILIFFRLPPWPPLSRYWVVTIREVRARLSKDSIRVMLPEYSQNSTRILSEYSPNCLTERYFSSIWLSEISKNNTRKLTECFRKLWEPIRELLSVPLAILICFRLPPGLGGLSYWE